MQCAKQTELLSNYLISISYNIKKRWIWHHIHIKILLLSLPNSKVIDTFLRITHLITHTVSNTQSELLMTLVKHPFS